MGVCMCVKITPCTAPPNLTLPRLRYSTVPCCTCNYRSLRIGMKCTFSLCKLVCRQLGRVVLSFHDRTQGHEAKILKASHRSAVVPGRDESTAVGECPYSFYRTVIVCIGIPAVRYLIHRARSAMERWHCGSRLVSYRHISSLVARLPACSASLVGLSLSQHKSINR